MNDIKIPTLIQKLYRFCWIGGTLPIGEVASSGVSACSLRSRLVFQPPDSPFAVQFQYDWPPEARGDVFSPSEQAELQEEQEEEEQYGERYSHSVSPEGAVFNHAHGSF